MTRPVHRRHKDEPDEPDLGGDDVADAMGFVLPGGRVDAEAVRKAIDDARAAKAAGGDADAAGDTDDEEVLPRVRFRLQHDLKKRLDKYLTDRITFMSRTQLQKLIDEGGATVNGRPAKASTFLRAGDVIEVVVPQPPDRTIPPEDIPLDVLYEDADIIVINKQPDIIVHPARSNLKGTMLSALAYHFKHRSPSGGGLSAVGDEFARPGVVHRLDRHTSGCIVFAKQNESHWKIGHQFEHRTVDKRYIALVQGKVEPDVQVIDLPIGPHPSREKGYRERYVVRFDDLGKNAVTICRVRERYHVGTPGTGPTGKVDAPGDYTLVELELKTGRTHQIRVHLSYLGWPIVGDDMYGGKPYLAGAGDRKGETIIARQALHACTLGFRHPISNQPVLFTAPLRGDMASLVHDLRLRSNGGQRVDAPGATVDLDWATGGL